MGRLLCLDYGRKRVGIAVTDPLKIIAAALETVPAHNIREYVKSYIAKEEVEGLVIGDPRTLRNEPSEAVRYIEPFLNWFSREFPGISIFRYDERFTSVLAQKAIIEAGVKKMARRDKSLADKVSASLILQSYLDSVANRGEPQA